MSADPTEPDTFEDETGPGEEEPDIETPEADAAEQRAELLEQEDSPLPDHVPDAANPADAVEQARVVEIDEEDYR
ncbi:hypothetical protein DMH02_019820 [Streptomyces sp. WAC 00631]|uniref:hypothetical protein n=1 Tax=unclassified Streptomyces TaxID=2593676 RepID=UPI000F774A91|nr:MULTISPECIES: hypothetical protein [unclassified Streptomyces]MCC5035400.1 hypothetical protein [Streptomyces sp. WAC 00631]MCC9739543.1 hypothetical protein [Streptomyces sp. MNU89]